MIPLPSEGLNALRPGQGSFLQEEIAREKDYSVCVPSCFFTMLGGSQRSHTMTTVPCF